MQRNVEDTALEKKHEVFSPAALIVFTADRHCGIPCGAFPLGTRLKMIGDGSLRA